ncbi:MAG: four-carbon acid sugar kinase family protein [Verrucomicrobia bacterium]|nr:four-carbon acid sugar kinase family protein [Verrucomicrobiota bacterium]
MAAILGCIADDFTGGTDLAGMLVKHGMRTVQMIGVPQTERCPADVDAVVIALKSRTNPASEAVRESLAALRWLQEAGCKQFYFKYCSTFDSTPQGNIGPVAEALMDALGTDFTIACPAFPANRRTIYQGYLFVGDVLLNESGMRHHPLTPMTDANLVRVLQAQVKRRVGLIDYGTVSQGSGVIDERFAALRKEGCGFAVVDALSNRDLAEIGAACASLPLVTAGSGLAVGLPENFRRKGLLAGDVVADALPATGGLRAVIAGSCSTATQGQVARMRERHPAFQVDPVKLAGGSDVAAAALEWAAERVGKEPVLIYATSAPEAVREVQAQFGAARAGELVEEALAAVARGLVELGVGQMIVAGGETSGAVVKALGIKGLRIGPEIDPGVPWTVALQTGTTHERPLALALKSGNFGTPDFFLKAWSYFS